MQFLMDIFSRIWSDLYSVVQSRENCMSWQKLHRPAKLADLCKKRTLQHCNFLVVIRYQADKTTMVSNRDFHALKIYDIDCNLHYMAQGTGCTPLWQCLGQLKMLIMTISFQKKKKSFTQTARISCEQRISSPLLTGFNVT